MLNERIKSEEGAEGEGCEWERKLGRWEWVEGIPDLGGASERRRTDGT